MLQISQLFTYPIKSLGGVLLSSAEVTDRGLKHDRRWMLVDENNQFLTQRIFPQMALLQVSIKEDSLLVSHKTGNDKIAIPFQPEGSSQQVQVWSDSCKGIEVSSGISDWFSQLLNKKCKLVYMPGSTKRRVDSRYAAHKEITSFSDGYPFLIIGQASLDDLNSRLEEPLPINRFRPNIVCEGSAPFEEDEWAHFTVNDINFYGVKLCARCVVTTIDQQKASKGKEPLRTLATYRMWSKKIYFGQNLLHSGEGLLQTGSAIEVKERKKARLPRVPSGLV